MITLEVIFKGGDYTPRPGLQYEIGEEVTVTVAKPTLAKARKLTEVRQEISKKALGALPVTKEDVGGPVGGLAVMAKKMQALLDAAQNTDDIEALLSQAKVMVKEPSKLELSEEKLYGPVIRRLVEDCAFFTMPVPRKRKES